MFCTFLSVWAFGFAMSISASDAESCLFWRRVAGLGWVTCPGILLHYILIVTKKNEWLKQWWLYFLIYVPAALMLYVFSLSHDLAIVQYAFLKTPFGWINRADDNLWDRLFYGYYFGMLLIALSILWRWSGKTGEESDRKQGKAIQLGLLLALLLALLAKIYTALQVSAYLFQLLPNVLFIVAVSIFYSIRKYKWIKVAPLNNEEVILNEQTRTRIYNYLSVAFVAGSGLNLLSQYFFEENGDLAGILRFSALLLVMGGLIQLLQHLNVFRRQRDTLILAVMMVMIPVITFQFIRVASLTVWAFPFILLIISLVFNNRIAIVGVTVSTFLTQILVFITRPQAIVEIDSDDFVVRMGFFGIAIWIAFFVNQLYVQRLKENAEQLKIEKIISEFSGDFVNINRMNFDKKMEKWITRSGELFDLTRVCVCYFDEDKKRLCCTQEWCGETVASEKERRQNFPVAKAPAWINTILANQVVHRFNQADSAPGKAKRMTAGDSCQAIDIAIPIACSGDVLGFIAFHLNTTRTELNKQYANLFEIIANILADAMLKMDKEKEIMHQAHYDQLTGLPNRLLFRDKLKHEILSARKNEKLIGVAFLDIDSFKTINDSIGHESGDKLLIQVGEKLCRSIKKTDAVCRYEGDEFLLMLNNIEKEKDILKIGNRIVNLFKHAFIVDGQEFYISANLGLAIYPTDGETAAELIKNADIAMYKSKEKGKNQYVLCSPAIKEEAHFKTQLTGHLYHALEREELQLYYQPQICLQSGKIVGVEALLRWLHPELQMIPPQMIIPLAEQTGLINPIGEWVLETACRQNKVWQEMGLPPVRMAVNISATQFRNPGLTNHLKKLLKETDLKPRYLELELTENIAINQADGIVAILERLKKLGVFISIDDFGTEYPSLSRLKTLPIDQLKIDKQFIDGVVDDEKDQTIVTAIILLAKNLGLNVISEGVETAEQLAFLKERQCDLVQGFYYHRPMPAEELQKILQQQKNIPENPPDYVRNWANSI